jgi:hypothetical protein|tara:strand:+ start:373 stop:555 length:183 start_codon:yes stop_codon:yes gene_type:complete
MKIEIKIELDGLAQDKFDAAVEARNADLDAHDDYSRYVREMESDAWLDYLAPRMAWMIGN